ncbi:MAG: ABC transporter permease [Gemmatimonadaceae bacterium]
MTLLPSSSSTVESVFVFCLGAFSVTALRLEITRVLRNRRTLFFIIVFPGVFFFIFRSSCGRNSVQADIIAAYVMISMAVYGAMVGTTSGGATVAIERSLGWSSQLRPTPLRPSAYAAMKVLTSMTLGLLAVCSTFFIGAVSGVHMAPETWLSPAYSRGHRHWCSLPSDYLVGFLFPAENVMQFVGPLMAVMAMFGIFVPLSQLPKGLQNFARFTPMYGVGIVARAPLVGGATAWAVGRIVVWTILFGVGAVMMFKRDAARV